MKRIIAAACLFTFFLSCKQKSNESGDEFAVDTVQEKPAPEKDVFIPVTSFIRGQVFEIKEKGINPVKLTSINGKTDSSWIKVGALETELAEFLTPVIDSTLAGLFLEKKFMDQTLNAFTLTYEPAAPLPDSIQLQHWDVYINPETNKVNRIYLVKKAGLQTKQLTWQSDKWCRIVIISEDKDGNSFVERETSYKWDF